MPEHMHPTNSKKKTALDSAPRAKKRLRDEKATTLSSTSKSTSDHGIPLDLEEGEDVALALEVHAKAAAFMKALGRKSSAAFLMEQRDAQGLGSDSENENEAVSVVKSKQLKKKSKETLQKESERNLKHQRALEAKRVRQAEREQRAVQDEEEKKLAERKRGKLFADNDDMWDD